METSTLSKPGTKFGPCAGDCKHLDCSATRSMAESVCKFCHKPIGYERAFYSTGDAYQHAVCAEIAIDVERGYDELWEQSRR